MIPLQAALQPLSVATLPAAADFTGTLLRQGGKLWYSDGATWSDLALSGGGVLNNLTASAAPASGNDSTQGYAVGSRWLWAARGLEWVAVDVTPGAAVWETTGQWLTVGTMQTTTAVGALGRSVEGSESVIAATATTAAFDRRRYATTATANARASVSVTTGRMFSSSVAVPRTLLRHGIFLPDASYGSGATGARICFGLLNNTFMNDVVSNNGRGHPNSRGAWFRFDTNAGDVNWQLIERTTATPTAAIVTNTGIPFSPGHFNLSLMWGGGVSTLFDIGFQQGSSRFRSTGRTGISGEYIVAFATVQTLTAVARSLDHINSAIMEQVTP